MEKVHNVHDKPQTYWQLLESKWELKWDKVLKIVMTWTLSYPHLPAAVYFVAEILSAKINQKQI